LDLPVYFYKADAPSGCFSNFSLHKIELADRLWQTVEHYYQAHKFVGTQGGELLIDRIWQAPTPEIAAAIGRSPDLLLRDDWHDRKWEIMYAGVRQKVLSHADVRSALISTGDREIIEDSPVDYYWGCGQDRSGANHLGKILMQIRQDLSGGQM
jgi:N-glycosidase YbiA